MKKIVLKSTLILGAVSFVFTGCTVVSEAVKVPTTTNIGKQFCKIKLKKPDNVCDIDKDLIVLNGRSNLSAYGMRHLDYTNSTAAVLQAAAQTTLKEGKKYFAVVDPSVISNYNGSLTNNAKDFMDQCKTTFGDIVKFQWDKCDLHPHNRFNANMSIVVFDKQQDNIVTYNANEVLNYLKEHDLYDKDSSIKKVNVLSTKK